MKTPKLEKRLRLLELTTDPKFQQLLKNATKFRNDLILDLLNKYEEKNENPQS